jgi:hypothetical protein
MHYHFKIWFLFYLNLQHKNFKTLVEYHELYHVEKKNSIISLVKKLKTMQYENFVLQFENIQFDKHFTFKNAMLGWF